MKRQWSRPALTLMIALCALGLVFVGMAIAQPESDTFTGCLTDAGKLKKVALGDEPAKPCSGSETEVQWNATGPPGPPGPPSVLSAEQRTTHGTSTGGHQVFSSDCEPGETLSGGGYSVGSIGFADKVFTNAPVDEDTWMISVINDSGFDIDVWVTAICLSTN